MFMRFWLLGTQSGVRTEVLNWTVNKNVLMKWVVVPMWYRPRVQKLRQWKMYSYIIVRIQCTSGFTDCLRGGRRTLCHKTLQETRSKYLHFFWCTGKRQSKGEINRLQNRRVIKG